MGNSSSHPKTKSKSKSNASNKLDKWLKMLSNSNVKNNDSFIIKYHHSHAISSNEDNIKSFDQRRVIFVSLVGLYLSWKQNNIPSFVLYSAIFLCPLKKKWIYDPENYIDEIKSHFISEFSAFSDISEMSTFIKLLKWKDNQGLAYWMYDDYDQHLYSAQIHPFWQYFNEQLTGLYDASHATSNNKYKPLNLDEKEWQSEMSLTAHKYCQQKNCIITELRFLTAKYKSMQEIIYQSNPKALLPVISYGSHQNVFKKLSELTNTDFDLSEQFDDDVINDKKDFWISEDYNPYEL